jgi:hypothetical protein
MPCGREQLPIAVPGPVVSVEYRRDWRTEGEKDPRTSSLCPQVRRRAKAMSRIDSLKEAKRGIGVTCQCGKSARLTVRGQTMCYECFDKQIGRILDPVRYAGQRMRERVREIDHLI